MAQAEKPIQDDYKLFKVSRRLGPPPTLTQLWPLEREPSLGKRGCKCYSHLGKNLAVQLLGRAELMRKRGRQPKSSRGLSLQAATMDISHRSVGPGKNVPDPGPSSSFSSEAGGPHPSPESSKRENGKGSHWASSIY